MASGRPVLLGLMAGIVAFAAIAGDAAAVRTRFFRTEGYSGFKKGELAGTALHEENGLVAAPRAAEISDPGVRTVWRLAVDSGGRVFAATGDQGQIHRATDGETFTLFSSLFNYELFALTPDGRGGCYVGGAPSGAISHVNSEGVSRTVFDAPEGLVLALLASPSGGVYAAAGERGRLYFIPEAGEARVVCESGDLHLRCLAWSTDGKKILAGTDGRGLVQEIDPSSGSVRILYDAQEDEIVALLPHEDGSILFAANPGDSGGGGAGAGAGAGGGGGGGEEAVILDHESPSAARGPSPVVYRIDGLGSARPLWRCPEKTIHALAGGPDGGFHAATGGSGALYLVTSEGKETVLWRAKEDQVTSLATDGDVLYAGTGSPGRIYRVGPAREAEGRYTSEVFDGGDLVRFGQIRWTGEGEGSIAFRTRTGFTSTPDESWSAWSAELPGDGGAVASPPGRYLQWQAVVRPKTGDRPLSVRRVEVAYVGTNRPPRIGALAISPDEPNFDGGESKRGSFSQTLGSGVEVDYNLPMVGVSVSASAEVPAAIRQLRSIAWEASDPDGDELQFRIELRRVGEDGWRLLEAASPRPAYSLETGLLPDGAYEIRVHATDSPGNAAGTEGTASRVTAPFTVDNLAPTVTELRARRVDGPALVVSGVATDESSPLRRMYVSVDGKSFRTLPPSDGMIDSRSERFEATVPLEHDAAGNWIVVRAQDSAGNQGSYRAWLDQ